MHAIFHSCSEPKIALKKPVFQKSMLYGIGSPEYLQKYSE